VYYCAASIVKDSKGADETGWVPHLVRAGGTGSRNSRSSSSSSVALAGGCTDKYKQLMF
jgi:hypothetical protein